MKLIVDTSSLCTLVILCSDQWQVIEYKIQSAVLTQDENGMASHNETLGVLVDDLLKKSSVQDLSQIAIGIGPGSFTGIRIGLSFTVGLGIGYRIPLRPLSSMRLFACCLDQQAVLYADARRDEFFAGVFDADGTALCQEHIASKETLEKLFSDHKHCRPFLIDGNGWEESLKVKLQEAVSQKKSLSGIERFSRPYSVDQYAQIEPLYIREVAARTIAERSKNTKL